MKTFLVLTVSSLLTVSTLGCGDDTGDGAGGSGGGGTTTATTGAETTGTGATGTTTATGGGAVTNCVELCDLEPTSTTSEKDCVADFVADAHPLVATQEECFEITSPETCDACYAAASIPDATCVSAHEACF